jgi:hypothetical protein
VVETNREDDIMAWPIKQRAADLETKIVPPSKNFTENVKAEQRLKTWQKELAAKRKVK